MNVCVHKHIEHLEEFIQNGVSVESVLEQAEGVSHNPYSFFFSFKNSGILSAYRYEVFGIFEIKKISKK